MSRIYFDKNKLNKKQKLSASDYFLVNDSETLNDETKYILVSDLQNSILYPEVNTYADLPEASTVTDKIYVVLQATGVYLINRKDAGMYYSNGYSWSILGNIPSYFMDNTFKVYNSTDTSKQVKFDASGLNAETLATISFHTNGNIDLSANQDVTSRVSSVSVATYWY